MAFTTPAKYEKWTIQLHLENKAYILMQKNPRVLSNTGIAYEYPNPQMDGDCCAFLPESYVNI